MPLFLLLALSAGISSEVFASGARSLPAGANNPAVVEKVFASPRGEVQFVTLAGGHSAFLRNNKGHLASFKEVRGPSTCDEWLISSKSEPMPRGCDFYFHDEHSGGLYSVRSEEMEESSLFQSVQGVSRRAIVTL